MNIKQLSPNPRNPRKIDQKKLEMLAKSMIEFGSLDGFIYNHKTKQLCGGHQRQRILPEDARVFVEKRYDKPTLQGTIASGYVEYLGERWPYREVDWSIEREKAANIAANKGAGEWDLPKLQEFVTELDSVNFDLDLTMFDSDELKDLFGKDFGGNKDRDSIEDEVPAPPKEPISKLGDLYELGNHRVLCGDSTDRSNVDLLMNGEKADMVFTDPPYGLGNKWSGGTWASNPMYADAKKWDQPLKQETIDWLISLAKDVVIWGGNYYVMPPSRCWLAWDKSNKMETMADFELAWTNFDKVAKSWTGARNTDGQRSHPTQKPVALLEWALNFSDAINIIDLFGGSGSTLIACEKSKRNCFMLELSPQYVEVIISRWCRYTGCLTVKKNGETIEWKI